MYTREEIMEIRNTSEQDRIEGVDGLSYVGDTDSNIRIDFFFQSFRVIMWRVYYYQKARL